MDKKEMERNIKEQEDEIRFTNKMVVVMFLVGLFIGTMFIGWGIWGTAVYGSDRDKLAAAICEMEYDMDFDMYLYDIVHCKAREKEPRMYDGIEVEVDAISKETLGFK